MSAQSGLQSAMEKLSKIVFWAESSTTIKRIDFNLAPASERASYEEALKLVTDAIKRGELTQAEFLHRVGIE
jgi:hypothetical protein